MLGEQDVSVVLRGSILLRDSVVRVVAPVVLDKIVSAVIGVVSIVLNVVAVAVES